MVGTISGFLSINPLSMLSVYMFYTDYTENLIYVFPEMNLCGLVDNSYHSCICEGFIFSQNWSAYLAAAK
jgi:hypothetical protein